MQELGITTSADALEFVGGSVTAGYWKSRVDASTGSRWSWDDNHEPFLTHLAVIDRFDDAADSTLAFPVANGRPSGTEALEKLRTNRPTHVDAIGVMGLIAMRSLSQVRSLDHGTIARVATSYNDVTREWMLIATDTTRPERNLHWREEVKLLLEARGITINAGAWQHVEFPTDLELQKLAYVAQMQLPRRIVEEDLDNIVGKRVEAGDWTDAEQLLEWMVANRPTDDTRNSLAYCKMLRGDVEGAQMIVAGIDFSRRNGPASYINIIEH